MNYIDFIAQKGIRQKSHGFEIEPSEIHPKLFPFQRDSVLWALRNGRAVYGSEYPRQIHSNTLQRVRQRMSDTSAHCNLAQLSDISNSIRIQVKLS